ncbi:MAG: YedE family putative selenium transporter [Eubacteriales bacterium]|nr:YedE family putative selenium transporter [Eubacteriales bacterium]
MKKNMMVIITGAVIGLVALILVALGNPANMGFCIACFLRDSAGSCSLHSAAAVQYFRPEIVGIVLGSLVISLCFGEFRARGGSSPVTRLILGFCVMVGALMFLGCPLRMLLRVGGGDLNAVVGLVGFIAGIGVGVLALNSGFSLRRSYAQSKSEGAAFPALVSILFILTLCVPALFLFSESGPGSQHAPILASLAGGLAVGALAQRSRFCMAGGLRDTMLFRDMHLLWGSIALLVVVLAGNFILGKFKLSFAEQPVAHTDGLWNFLGMATVGWGSVLLGGCPLRQLVMAGEGDSDAAVTITGMVLGAALCHNWGLASSGNGPTANGQIAVVVCLAILLVISLCNILKGGKKA